MTPNFSCTLFNVSGSAHEKFGVMGRFDNVLWLKQRVNVLSVRMLEKITLQGRSVTIRLTDKSVSIFKETIKKNTEKDKVVKLWNKNVQSNKSLAN